MKRLRVGFMGTPDFALEALKALCASAHDVVCVYSQPPRPKGRGHKVQSAPVHEYALTQDIPVFHPVHFKDNADVEVFRSHDLDISVVAAYGLILPSAILNTPRFGCVNIHASLLPRWRGASPIHRAIWEGDNHTGVTLMQMDEGLDTGDMIVKESVVITDETTLPVLHDALAILGGQMIVDLMDRFAAGEVIKKEEQNNQEVTYAGLLKKEDGRIDWSQKAVEIHRQMRALIPWPGVWSELDGKRFKIHAVSLSDQKSESPAGSILDPQGHAVCGDGEVVQIQKIQPAGAKAMDFVSAVNGGYISVGARFE